MKCALGCMASKAIGLATLMGMKNSPTEGQVGTYALCSYHYETAKRGEWPNSQLIGWDPFGTETPSEKAQAHSDKPWD